MEANDKNTLVGSFVKKKDKCYYVYKVNKLFVWAGKVSVKAVIDGWKHKEKDETWIQYMGKIGAEKLTFKGMSLENNDEALPAKSKANKNKAFLSNCCEREIAKLIKAKSKNKSWRHNTTCSQCSKVFRAIKFDEIGRIMISYDYNLFYFNIETKEYELYKTYLTGDSKEPEPILKEPKEAEAV